MDRQNNQNYDLLIAAIIKKAVRDYRSALIKFYDTGEKTPMLRETESFFYSEWGNVVCMGYNYFIAKRVREDVLGRGAGDYRPDRFNSERV